MPNRPDPGSYGQEHLVTFLRAEIDLAMTFCDSARITEDVEHRARSLAHVRVAIETIHHFEGRVADRKVSREISDGTKRLERLLAEQT